MRQPANFQSLTHTPRQRPSQKSRTSAFDSRLPPQFTVEPHLPYVWPLPHVDIFASHVGLLDLFAQSIFWRVIFCGAFWCGVIFSNAFFVCSRMCGPSSAVVCGPILVSARLYGLPALWLNLIHNTTTTTTTAASTTTATTTTSTTTTTTTATRTATTTTTTATTTMTTTTTTTTTVATTTTSTNYFQLPAKWWGIWGLERRHERYGLDTESAPATATEACRCSSSRTRNPGFAKLWASRMALNEV